MNDIFACGIDLGTINCRIASFKNGEPVVQQYSRECKAFQSLVCFKSNEEVFVGARARNIMFKHLYTSIYDIKRLIGKRIDDPGVQEDKNHLPFKISGNEDENVIIHITINGKTIKYSPEKLSSLVLKYVSEKVGSYSQLNEEQIIHAVIAVPACFTDSQRRATIEAARLAGINVLRLINEPTAAAITYAYKSVRDKNGKNNIRKNIMVYDFGGGTFDVSIISIVNNVITVKATGGDSHLGGEDITNNLVKYLLNVIQDESGVDLSNNNKIKYRLKTACEEGKEILSEMTETDIVCGLVKGEELFYTVKRSELVEINVDIFNKTMRIVKDTIKNAYLSKELIDEIVLVGGSSRIPEVERLLESEFPGIVINKGINSDEAVSIGASILADDICRRVKEKCFDNGSLSLVDENNNLISVINDIPPPPPSTDSPYFLPSSQTKSPDKSSPLSNTAINGEIHKPDKNPKNPPSSPTNPTNPSPDNPYPDNPQPIVMNSSLITSKSIESISVIHPNIRYSMYEKDEKSYNFVVNDVLTHNIGIITLNEEGNDINDIVIPKHTIIPYELISGSYSTVEDDQTEISFSYCECDSDDVNDCIRIKTIYIKDIPKMKRGEMKFIHRINIDRNGLITITITIKSRNDVNQNLVTTM